MYDYDYLKGILENFNELSKFIAQCSISQLPAQLTREQRKQIEKEALSKNQLPDWQIKGFVKFFNIFYKGRCMVTLYTNTNVPELSFTGHLKKAFIRDGLESVMFRYGTSPQILWNIFAQIAYIPHKSESVQNSMIPQKTQSLDESLRGVFDAMRGIEKMATAISYPAISIIPIAIYR
ncbi:MAG: hypothetical protein V3T73_04625 [Dehalococcoidales bacterium]